MWISSERGVIDSTSLTSDQADTKGKNNYIEVLTQYSPYLENIDEYVGLDLSLTFNTYARAIADDLDAITDIDEGRSTNFAAGALKIKTGFAHGLSPGDKFKITGVCGGLSFLNSGERYSATAADTTGSIIYTTNRRNPSGDGSNNSLSGNKLPWSGTGRIIPRRSTISFIGSSDHNSIAVWHQPLYGGSFLSPVSNS